MSVLPAAGVDFEVTVEVVGVAPVVAVPGKTLVVERRIGSLSPILISAF